MNREKEKRYFVCLFERGERREREREKRKRERERKEEA